MTAPLILALILGLAPTSAGASAPSRAHELSEEAAVFAGQAKSGSDPGEIAVAALQAYNMWRQAHELDGDDQHLCHARALLREICRRADLDPVHRASLERRRDALSSITCRSSAPPAAVRSASKATSPKSTSQARFLPLTAGTAGDASPPPRATVQEDEASRPEARDAAATAPSDPTTAVVVRESDPIEPLPIDRDQPTTPRRGMWIGGGTSLALGLVALGVMVPFAARDAAIAREVRELAAIKDAAGGALDPVQAARFEELRADGQTTFRAALALGIGGGLAVAAGTGLMIAAKRSARPFALGPQVGPRSAGLVIQGRF
ncbi:MAG: hypothetical protein H6711_15050 [Myxococcales bacterium]|nr:hypothetical protein [Myxococcales bacterium]